jgi:hypothetical protein
MALLVMWRRWPARFLLLFFHAVDVLRRLVIFCAYFAVLAAICQENFGIKLYSEC